MKDCQRCNSPRVIAVYGKCSDLFSAVVDEAEHDGYVLHDIGIGGGDDMTFDYCMNCGQIQGEFPLPLTQLETVEEIDYITTKEQFEEWAISEEWIRDGSGWYRLRNGKRVIDLDEREMLKKYAEHLDMEDMRENLRSLGR